MPNEFERIKLQISEIKDEFHNFKVEIKQQIKEDYGKIILIVDEIFKKLSNGGVSKETKFILEENLLQDFKFPLKSCEEVTSLDDNIRKNNEFRTQLVNTILVFIMLRASFTLLQIELLSKIGGKGGEQDGMKIGYKLVDQVFYEVILSADTGYTKKKNSNLFKDGVLKHARKRIYRKQ